MSRRRGGWSPSSNPDVGRLQVHLTVDAEGRINSLWFTPALEDPPETLDQIAQLVDGYGPTSAFLAAEIDDTGVCQPIAVLRADLVLPLGSVFKLYVLGAVATAVDEGTLTWDEPVEIRDEIDSSPSGITQDEPAGSNLSVKELARRMVAISDNTATDHLIDLVGREHVEAALKDFGHTNPQITMPFLTTHELFALRSNYHLRNRYIDSDLIGRRALLGDEITGRPVNLLAWTEPRDVTTVEWFATPIDILPRPGCPRRPRRRSGPRSRPRDHDCQRRVHYRPTHPCALQARQ